MNETLTKIATYTAAGGETSFTFSNIPQYYTDLKLVVSARTNRAAGADTIKVTFNGVSTGYTNRMLYGNGATTASSTGTSNILESIWTTDSSSTGSIFGSSEILIPNYSSTKYKVVSSENVTEQSGATAYIDTTAGLWSNNAPITSITLAPYQGTAFSSYSTFTLYGIKNYTATLGNSIKATGGVISFDGTYVYHTFTSTDAFVPNTRILADALVIAGGGAGGGDTNNGGGGGGAGGLVWRPSTTYYPTSYVVSIGAGGTGVSANTGNSGTNSLFDTITALGGGGGGAGPNISAGASGGSGGGGGGGALAGGAATQGASGGGIGYGNAGGLSASGPCGGGGGAGAAGSNGINATQQGGNGGNGLSGTTIAALNGIGAATGTGQNVSGTYYYAGGGAGSYTIVGTPGLGGGGVALQGAVGGGGTSNTGGGGAGTSASGSAAGGSGGSGIVIVRYKA